MKMLVVAFLTVSSLGSAFGQKIEKEKLSQDSTYVKVKCSPTIRTDAPLYILDDVEICAEDINKIDPNMIESINVLKTAKDIEPYGEKGKYGVILIELKGAKRNSRKG
jgi:hypothetical protein